MIYALCPLKFSLNHCFRETTCKFQFSPFAQFSVIECLAQLVKRSNDVCKQQIAGSILGLEVELESRFGPVIVGPPVVKFESNLIAPEYNSLITMLI